MYQPVKAPFPLEQEEVFSKSKQPSNLFLRFAEQYISNDKSDHLHNPCFKSCIIRILASHSSKHIARNNGSIDTSTREVTITQRWDGNRPKINWLLRDYRRCS